MITTNEYSEFDRAYDYFNAELFGGKLPLVMFTLQRHKGALGYFSNSRFAHRHDEATRVDEIALNPSYFEERTDLEILSTLVHEMTHVWQQHFGEPGRGRYHNKEWAEKMKEIGLYPSSTGQPGGKETGDSMSHYIIDNGPFDRAARALIATGYAINYQSIDYLLLTGTNGSNGSEPDDEEGDDEEPKPKPKSKVKFTCIECGNNAWGKPSLALLCNNLEKHPQPIAMEKQE